MKKTETKRNSEIYKRVISSVSIIFLTIFSISAGDIINVVFFSLCFMCAISEWYNISLKICKIRKKMWIFYEETNINSNEDFSNQYNMKFFMIFLAGVVYIFLGFYNLFILSIFKWPAFFILGISSVTDTFAYIGGKYFQGKKLCPKISPGKTVAGLICGVLAAGMFSVFSRNHSDFFNLALTFVQGLFLGCVSQLGDLLESFAKRKANLKNSGNLIPGHGGILDRIDGTLCISFVLSIYFLFQ